MTMSIYAHITSDARYASLADVAVAQTEEYIKYHTQRAAQLSERQT